MPSKPKGRMMSAADVRTGDQVVGVDGTTRTVTQARMRGGEVQLFHGPNRHTLSPAAMPVRVIRSSRVVAG